eukprot:scaffold97444_cov80-Phaeocystis_antarctica.AAC.1
MWSQGTCGPAGCCDGEAGHCAGLVLATNPTDRPDLTARPVLGIGSGVKQGAEMAGLTCLQHSCVRQRAGFHIAWPWLSRGRRGVSGALIAPEVVSVRPSRRDP